jgi:hypothetical protein
MIDYDAWLEGPYTDVETDHEDTELDEQPRAEEDKDK